MSKDLDDSEFDVNDMSNQFANDPPDPKESKPKPTRNTRQPARNPKIDTSWKDKKNYRSDDSISEMSDSDNFLAKGAFLLTPSHELTIDRAALICEKMTFKGYFSLTKTATGILFKFSHPEDFQNVFRKGFHRVTGARYYRKVSKMCAFKNMENIQTKNLQTKKT